MRTEYILDDPRFLLLVIGVAWSALLALAKRAVTQVENKINDNAKKVAALQSQIATMIGDSKYRIERNFRDLVDESREEIKTLSASINKMADERNDQINRIKNENLKRTEEIRRQTVTRSEFRLLALNLYTMLETIHSHIIQSGAKK